MKKWLLTLLMIPAAIFAFAQDIVDEAKMKRTLELFGNIEGYVFIEKGENKARELSETFARTDSVLTNSTVADLKDMSWNVYNDFIARINDTGKIVGRNYGQTLIELTEADETVHNFIVFVCPTVTIISPDGVVYTHQKIYNQKMKVDFTHSANYSINCIMVDFDGETYEITDNVDPITGHYESTAHITNDVSYTITMEENPNNVVIGEAPIKLRVVNGIIEFSTRNKSLDYLKECSIFVSDINGTEILSDKLDNCISYDSEYPEFIHSLDDGIYFVKIDDNDNNAYNYKIIIKK